ncbi:MAG: 6,7-dimethyl-8-ribityllumazine synthase [Bacteroidetes bacterium]|mgnify:CR=1 FL=1|jgi:6,7-dimethyl-8-ribityllumazine synthase|nr:6,7-dimethyl-8-ribityllumazine synthase [Bacteroidota bacterium]
MSSKDKNLSEFSGKLPTLPNAKIGIVVSEWNEAVTGALLSGALKVLVEAGIPESNIKTIQVPGSYELILGSQKLAQIEDIDAVISIGCVIQGETRHFDFICQAVATGISDVNLKFDKPVIFGVLTTDNQQQALDRAGGKHGNKGEEAAYTALRMVEGVII